MPLSPILVAAFSILAPFVLRSLLRERFYGWVITACTFVTFGLAVGIPYYAMPFFYDYYEKPPELGGFGWTRSQITLGFPLAALFTLWVGPVLVHRFSPRKMLLVGTACTAVAFFGFGKMTGDLTFYYFMWFVYVVGYLFSGPIPHQVLISFWFRKRRGTAMGLAYLGVGLFGALSAKFVAQPLTEALGFKNALIGIGLLMFCVWPIALFLVKDKPSDLGLLPDGAQPEDYAAALEAEKRQKPKSFRYLLRQPAFYLLAIGSFCSIGAIGAINQHMKLVFKDKFEAAGYAGEAWQSTLNTVFSNATFAILLSSMVGRIGMGWLADRFTKKKVMVITYLIVAFSIPLLLFTMHPPETPYLFSILFGFAMGADYMLIPLMAAEQFGVATLARAMAIILPTDTIGQTWFPYLIAVLREHYGEYTEPLLLVFVLAFLGAVAIMLLPKPSSNADEAEEGVEPAKQKAEQRSSPEL